MTTTSTDKVCVECRAIAPATDSAYTLISQRFGWRLVYALDAQGKRVPQWRCDKCFRRSKARAE
jgi:hypothetical protein